MSSDLSGSLVPKKSHEQSVFIRTMASIATYAIIDTFDQTLKVLLSQIIGSSLAFTRIGLQCLIAIAYTLLLPSRLIFLAAIPILHTALFNVHLALPLNTSKLNTTLSHQGYSLIARQESLTGYISVLDNVQDGFRVMRCDHSLLGGEWIYQPDLGGSALREPIYSVFVMLEAVRLVQKEAPKSSGPEQALVMWVGP